MERGSISCRHILCHTPTATRPVPLSIAPAPLSSSHATPPPSSHLSHSYHQNQPPLIPSSPEELVGAEGLYAQEPAHVDQVDALEVVERDLVVEERGELLWEWAGRESGVGKGAATITVTLSSTHISSNQPFISTHIHSPAAPCCSRSSPTAPGA